MHEKGKKFNVAKVGSKTQFRDYILRKLDEEYNEFKAAAEDNNMFGIEEELADMYEVLDAACEFVEGRVQGKVL
jgi:predicted house-cleaning noncanonical NTP pyrophosphatase (MazG superfamily)